MEVPQHWFTKIKIVRVSEIVFPLRLTHYFSAFLFVWLHIACNLYNGPEINLSHAGKWLYLVWSGSNDSVPEFYALPVRKREGFLCWGKPWFMKLNRLVVSIVESKNGCCSFMLNKMLGLFKWQVRFSGELNIVFRFCQFEFCVGPEVMNTSLFLSERMHENHASYWPQRHFLVGKNAPIRKSF